MGILALCAGTPIVALSYLPKTDGVLERFGIADLILPAGNFDGPELARLIDRASDEAGLVGFVEGQLARLRSSAGRAIELTLAIARSREPVSS